MRKKERCDRKFCSTYWRFKYSFPVSEDKSVFLDGIKAICDDGIPRFLVPEVNSGGEDLRSVVIDVLNI